MTSGPDPAAEMAALAASADDFAERGEYRQALRDYARAWQLLPEPRMKQPAAVWILAAIADAAFKGGFRSAAQDAVDHAEQCREAQGNATIHLRRGQLLFDKRSFDAAADELMRAYSAGGLDVFAGEPEKYLRLLRSRTTLS